MNGFDVRVPCEVSVVEGQNLLDGMHSHRGNQTCVVDLDSGNVMRHQQLAPFLMNRQTVGQELHSLLEIANTNGCVLRCEAISVSIKGTRTGIPELRDVLRGIAEDGAALQNRINGGRYERVIMIIRFQPTKENVGVHQIWRGSHLASVLIEALAGETFRWEVR